MPFVYFPNEFSQFGSTFLILTKKGPGTQVQGSHFFRLCSSSSVGYFERRKHVTVEQDASCGGESNWWQFQRKWWQIKLVAIQKEGN